MHKYIRILVKRKERQTVHMNTASNNSRKYFPFERLVMTKEKKSKKLKENPIAKRKKETNKHASEQRSILK